MAFDTDGIHAGVPFAEYLGHPAFSSSDLRTFRQGPPAMVPWKREHRDQDATDATRLGSAAHCRILTPNEFEQRFVVKPAGLEFRTKEAKDLRDGWLAAGLTILSSAEDDQVRQIAKAFQAKATAQQSLAAATHVEASMLWTCRRTGLPCKGRPDWVDGDAVYDLKLSVEAEKSLEQLRFRAHQNGWLNQLAHYRFGLGSLGHPVRVGRLVVVAPRSPQDLRVWLIELNEDAMDHLELANEITRKQIAECHRRGHWPATPDTWQQVELPPSAVFVDEVDLEGAEEDLFHV